MVNQESTVSVNASLVNATEQCYNKMPSDILSYMASVGAANSNEFSNRVLQSSEENIVEWFDRALDGSPDGYSSVISTFLVELYKAVINNIELSKAAKIISVKAVKMRFKLNQELERLNADYKKYEEDYVKANDGDSSENAPLEEARKNLKLTTGNIVSKMVLIQKMDKIDEASYVINTYNYSDIEGCYDILNPEAISALESFFECTGKLEFMNFIKQSSRTEFENKLQSYIDYVEVLNIDEHKTELSLMHALVKYFHARKKPKYNSCGFVSIYSTVRLDYMGEIMTYSIYPDDISFIDDGVMAANSRLSSVLLGMKAGDTIVLPNSSTSINLTCKILEVY